MHRILRFFTIFILIGEPALSTMPGYAKASEPCIPVPIDGSLGAGRKARKSGLGRGRGFGFEAVQCGGCAASRAEAFVALRIGDARPGRHLSSGFWRAVGGPSRLPGAAGSRPPGVSTVQAAFAPGAIRFCFGGLTKESPERSTGCPSV